MAQVHTSNSSFLIGDIKLSEMKRKIYSPEEEFKIRTAETFLFELSELMKEYGVVKVDVCFDAFAFSEQKLNTDISQ